MSINIIIIGAKNNIDYNINDIYTYNNIKQVELFDLILLKDKYKSKIICLDPAYEKSEDILDIKFINKSFILGDIEYLDINSHNIIIEFCNLLNENFINNIEDTQYNNIIKYKNYKISWLSCGCCWNNYFPLDTIEYLIDNKIYTPLDALSVNSYIISKTLTNNFIKNNVKELMKPFSQGVYQILGSLLFRGFKDNYKYEEVLYELIKEINIDINDDNIIKFINKEIHWNFLNRNTRLSYHNVIYGENIKIDI